MDGQLTPADMSPIDRDYLIRTVIGEAAAEPDQGQQAVAAVIRNRLNSGKYGNSIPDVVTAPNQFEPYNTPQGRNRMFSVSPDSPVYQRAAQNVDSYLQSGDDPTQGATHFFAPQLQAQLGRRVPSWATPDTQTTQIGGHTFYAPEGRVGSQAMAYADPQQGQELPPELQDKPTAQKTTGLFDDILKPSKQEAQPAKTTGLFDDVLKPSKPTAMQKAVEPITSYPSTYNQMRQEAQSQVGTGVGQIANAQGGWDYAKGAANVGLGSLGYVSSPISAALRTIVGKPVEENTGIPKEYSEFAAGLALPGVGLRSAASVPAMPALAGPLSKTEEIAKAAGRLGVNIPKAAATESIPLQATAGAVKEMPIIGAPLVKASREAAQGIENAVGDTAASYGQGTTFAGGQAAKKGITNWVSNKSGDIAESLYGSHDPNSPYYLSGVSKYVDPAVTTPLDATKKMAENIAAKNTAAGLPAGKAVDIVQNALGAENGLPYDAIKTLRTKIGEMADSGIVPEGMSKGDLKQIYGSLTTDLRNAAQNAGGDQGLAAFDRANSLYSQIASRREALASIVGNDANAPPEQVMSRILQMASGKSGADIIKLTQARKAMGPDNWNEVTAGIINRMGRSAEDADFSGSKFVTAWNNMSDAGKKLLFNSTGNEAGSKAMNDLVTLSNAHKRLLDLGNPSGTGRVATVGGILGGLVAEPISTITAALGGNLFARVMSSPVTAKETSNWAKAYSAAARNPGPVTQTALANATANFAQKVSSQTGIDPLLIFKKMQSPSVVPAADQDQGNNPGLPSQQKRGGKVSGKQSAAHVK